MFWRLCAIFFFTAAAAAADPLAETRAALQRFGGNQPLHAIVELERSRHSRGRFLNDDFDGRVSFEIDADASAVRVTYGRALLERSADESSAQQRALVEAQAPSIANAIDSAAPLLRLLSRGRVIDPRGARLLTLQLPPRASGDDFGDVDDDRVTIWLGADGVPVAARRDRRGTAGMLFVRISTVRTESWSFGVRGDHLIALRFEDHSSVSGPGQHGEARSVWTVRPQ